VLAPVARFFRLTPGLEPQTQVAESSSPKFHRYSRSWNGLLVEVAVVPVASKKTDSGATPESLLASAAIVMAALPPLELLLDDDELEEDEELEEDDELDDELLDEELDDELLELEDELEEPPPPQPVKSADKQALRITRNRRAR
jgi:hypothetical protein